MSLLSRSHKLQVILIWLSKKPVEICLRKQTKILKNCFYLVQGKRAHLLIGQIRRIHNQMQDIVEKRTKTITRSFIISYRGGCVLKKR